MYCGHATASMLRHVYVLVYAYVCVCVYVTSQQAAEY